MASSGGQGGGTAPPPPPPPVRAGGDGGPFDIMPLSEFDFDFDLTKGEGGGGGEGPQQQQQQQQQLWDDEETVLALKRQVNNMNTVLKKIHEIQERDLSKSLLTMMKRERKVYRSDQLLQQQGGGSGRMPSSSSSSKSSSDDFDEYDDDLDVSKSDSYEFLLPGGGGGGGGGGNHNNSNNNHDDHDDYKEEEDVQGNIPMTASHSEELLRKELSEIDKLLTRLTQQQHVHHHQSSYITTNKGGYYYDLHADILKDVNRITATLTSVMSKFLPSSLPFEDDTNSSSSSSSKGIPNTDKETISSVVNIDHDNMTDDTDADADADAGEAEAEITKDESFKRKKKKKKKQRQSDTNEGGSEEEDDERREQDTSAIIGKTTKGGRSIVTVVSTTNTPRDLDQDDRRDGVASPEIDDDDDNDDDDDDGNGNSCGDPYCSSGIDNPNNLFEDSIDCASITMTFVACSDYLGVGNCPGGPPSSKATTDGPADDDFGVSYNNNKKSSKSNRKRSSTTNSNISNNGKQPTATVLDAADVSGFQVMANKAIDDMTQKAIAVCGSPRNENDDLGKPYSLFVSTSKSKRSSIYESRVEQHSDQPAVDDLLLQENKSSDSSGGGHGGDGDGNGEYIQQASLSTISEHYSRENISMSITPRDTNRTPSPILPDSHQQNNEHDPAELDGGDDQILTTAAQGNKTIGLQSGDVVASNDPEIKTRNIELPSAQEDLVRNDPPDASSAVDDVATPLPTHPADDTDLKEPPAINQRPTVSEGSDGNDVVVQTPKKKEKKKEEIVNLLEMPTLDDERKNNDVKPDMEEENSMDLVENDIPQISLKRRIRKPSEDIPTAAAATADGDDTSSSASNNDEIDDAFHLKEVAELYPSNTNSGSDSMKSDLEQTNGTRKYVPSTDKGDDAASHHRRLTATTDLDFDYDHADIDEVPSDEGLSQPKIPRRTKSSRNRRPPSSSSSSSLTIDTTTTTTTTTNTSTKKMARPSPSSSSPSSFLLNQKYSPMNAAASPRASFSARYGSLNPSPRRDDIWRLRVDADVDDVDVDAADK